MTDTPSRSVGSVPAPETGTPSACGNCGTPLLGPHCYRCGQPVEGLVRHFSSILGDFMDSVLDFDARIFRTLWPLFARPGFLSREYFAGRRVRYVSPVRLFVFLSIVTFFFAQFMIQLGNDNTDIARSDGDNSSIAGAMTVGDALSARDEALKAIAEGRRDAGSAPGVATGLAAAERSIRSTTDARIAELQKAKAAGKPPPKPMQDTLSFNGRPWNAVTNPIRVRWLPGFVNEWMNRQIGHAQHNIARIKDDPNLFKNAVLGALPSTLFVLLPIFALMLKILYLLKRRLYMEHLIVALHSHAFLSLALLAIFGLTALGNAVPAVHGVTGKLEALVIVWMPLYLLLMQKRVYGQGWTMTLLKYCVLGVSYLILLSLGVVFTMFLSLVWM